MNKYQPQTADHTCTKELFFFNGHIEMFVYTGKGISEMAGSHVDW